MSSTCPGHEREPRGYTNGGGFCIHCGGFAAGVFTGDDLGQYCYVCGEGTLSKDYVGFVCQEHHPGREFLDRAHDLKETGRGHDAHGNTWAMLVHAFGLAEKGENARSSLFD